MTAPGAPAYRVLMEQLTSVSEELDVRKEEVLILRSQLVSQKEAVQPKVSAVHGCMGLGSASLLTFPPDLRQPTHRNLCIRTGGSVGFLNIAVLSQLGWFRGALSILAGPCRCHLLQDTLWWSPKPGAAARPGEARLYLFVLQTVRRGEGVKEKRGGNQRRS